VLAQEAVNQRWKTYEEMANRGAQRFPADARARDADTGVPPGNGHGVPSIVVDPVEKVAW
jgi:hypothetical protein